MLDANRGVQVQPNGYCVAELVPRLPPGEWLLEGRLRHTAGFGGVIGIVVGVSRVSAAHATGVAGFALTYREADPGVGPTRDPPVATTRVVLAESNEAQLYPASEYVFQVPGRPLPAPPGADPSPPRSVTLTLMASEAAARIDTTDLGRCRFPEYEGRRDAVLRGRGYDAPVKADPPLGGGVGIFCKVGTAEVLSFTVRSVQRQV